MPSWKVGLPHATPCRPTEAAFAHLTQYTSPQPRPPPYITPCRGPTTQDTISRPRTICALAFEGPTLTDNSSALNETARKAAKSKNDKGSPFKLPSKILAVVADPQDESQIYVAEAAGNVKRINLEVGQTSTPLPCAPPCMYPRRTKADSTPFAD